MKYSTLPKPPPNAKQLACNLRNRMTETEWKFWGHIRNKQLGIRFKRQVPIGTYIVDFFALEIGLVIEIDGSQHLTDNGIRKDKIRTDFLEKYGIKILRYTNFDIFENIIGVIEEINYTIQKLKAKSSPTMGRI